MSADGWETLTVGDVAQVKGGKRLPAGCYVQDEPTPYPYLRVTDMRDGGIDESDIKYVPAEAASGIRTYRIRANDIFISVAGTLGIVGRIPPRLDGANLTENADRLTEIKCDVDYLSHFLRSSLIQNKIDSIRTVGAQPKLALGRIKTFELHIPKNRAEQESVAGALTDADNYIGLLERLIAKKRAIKQGVTQELLTGCTRLPGFADEWQAPTSLTDLCTRHAGYWGLSQQTSAARNPVRVITAGDISPRGRITGAAERFFTDAQLSTAQCCAGDLVITSSGNGLGKTAYVGEAGRLAASNFVRILRPLRGVSGEFLAQVMWTSVARAMLDSNTATSAYPNLMPSFFTERWIPLPSFEEQTVIATALRDADEEIAALERRLETARAIKQGMVQELLTGRTRLVSIEAPA